MSDSNPTSMHTWHVQLMNGPTVTIVARRLHVTDPGTLIFYSGQADDEHIVNVFSPISYVSVDKRS